MPGGKLAGTLQGQYGSVTTVAFSPDGGQLLTEAMDETVVIWDAAALPTAKAPAARTLAPAELAALWDDLAGPGGRKAYQAIASLSTGGKGSLEFLRTRLQPAKRLPQEELNRLVTALGDQA